MNQVIKGIAAASGIAMGPAYIIGREEFNIPKEKIAEKQIALQIQIFEEALIKTRKEILDLQKKIAVEMGQEGAEIFNAHLLVLEDRMLVDEVISRLKKEKLTVAYIFSEVLKKYISVFSKIEDEYLKERISDISDVGKRVLRNLLSKKRTTLEELKLKEKVVVVAHDLSPSDTAAMHKKNVAALAVDIGGKTSHTAIMAKSLEIPAVVGLEVATVKIKIGDFLIVDGSEGLVVINPSKKTIEHYKHQEEKIKNFNKQFVSLKDLPAQTLDGHKVDLVANIELPEEIPSILKHGAEGIGLYRTEYFYMNRPDLPSEDEHFQAYKYVAEAFKPHPVIIRTLDLGGDKFLSQIEIPKEMKPFLGWRAIRFCLARPDIFKVQLQAILRASVYGDLKIMYPMISGIEELRQANTLLEESKKELRTKKIPFNEQMHVGVMIEVPSAVMTADLLAKESDFFSIGTNDLIQYSLAIDRTNEKVAYLYEPTHPAVLRMIRNIIEAGHAKGIWVGMCGEMAAELFLVPILLGLGLDEFSIESLMIPEIKQIIRSLSFNQAKQIAEEALLFSTAKEVEEFAKNKFKEMRKLNEARV